MSRVRRSLQSVIGAGAALSLALISVAWTGCGSGTATAPVSGTVSIEGHPMTGGNITFAPIGSGTNAGRPATGQVQSDGTFVLGTYAKQDGAVVGKHRVLYSPPAGEHDQDGGEHDEKKRGPSSKRLVPKVEEVEVQAGQNQFNIELVTPSN